MKLSYFLHVSNSNRDFTSDKLVIEGCNEFSDTIQTPTFFFEVTGEQMWTLELGQVHAEFFEQVEFPYILSSCSRVWIWVLQLNFKKQYLYLLLTNTVGFWWAFFLFIVWIPKIQMFTLELRCCLKFIQLQLLYSIKMCFLMQYMQIYFQCFVCWLNRVVGNDILIMMALFRLVVHSHSPWN